MCAQLQAVVLYGVEPIWDAAKVVVDDRQLDTVRPRHASVPLEQRLNQILPEEAGSPCQEEPRARHPLKLCG